LLLFVSEITGSEVNKRVDTVWHQWCARIACESACGPESAE